MKTVHALALVAAVAMTACAGERNREIAVSDSLSHDLELAPTDTVAPRAAAGGGRLGGYRYRDEPNSTGPGWCPDAGSRGAACGDPPERVTSPSTDESPDDGS